MTLSQLAQAIAKGEGYGASPSNRPTRNNNPGDLTGTGYPGQIGTDPQGFAIFSSPAAGAAAQQQYLASHLSAVGSGTGPYSSLGPSSTFQDFLDIYAGNPDAGYVSTVANGSGIAPSTPLSAVLASLGLGGMSSQSPAAIVAANEASSPAATDLIDFAASDTATGISPGVLIAGAVLASGLLLWALG